MFGSKKTEETKTSTMTASTTTTKASVTESNALNSLVKGTIVEGTISSESDIRVDGIIKGNLTCKAKVIVGSTGFIEGEVRCQNAMIEGKIFGKLRVSELLTVKETAEIVGDVTTSKLMVANGAVFNVTCNMKDSISSTANNSNGTVKHQKEAEIVGNGKS